MDYCEKLKHYLDYCDENIDLIEEAIASLEGHFELIQENELLHFSRVDAVAYLALKSIVRCKDCKYGARLERTGMTPLVTCKGEDHELNWFCADGECHD